MRSIIGRCGKPLCVVISLALTLGLMSFAMTASGPVSNLSRGGGAISAMAISADEIEGSNTLVPKPVKATYYEGSYTLSANSRILGNNEAAREVGEFLASKLRPSTGFALPVVEYTTAQNNPTDIILLTIPESEQLSGDVGYNTVTANGGSYKVGIEGYALSASPEGLYIRAYGPEGLFRGVQSVRQLLPPDIEKDSAVTGVSWSINAIDIVDYPRYEYRGVMLDVSRKWFPKEEILRQIDLMSQFKLNVVRLHLTEDQGFRLTFDGYPELNMFGSTTKDVYQGTYNGANVVGTLSRLIPGSVSYGATPGYLTKADFLEILAYADVRFVTIIPEVEFPSHNYSQQVSLPMLRSDGQLPNAALTGNNAFWTDAVGQTVTVNPNGTTVAAKYTKAFMVDIFTQLSKMLYGRHKYIHVGGDEASNQNSTDYIEVSRLAIDTVRANGLISMGWAMTSARTTSIPHYWVDVFQSWNTGNNGINDAERPLAANPNNKVVVSTASLMYLDHFTSSAAANRMPVGHSWAASTGVPIATVFNLNPEERIPAGYRNQGRVLGVEGPVWSETYGTRQMLDLLIYPRALALSEIGWSPDTTRSGTGSGSEWAVSFQPRLSAQGMRLTNEGITFANDTSVWPAKTVTISTANGVYNSPVALAMNTTMTGKFNFNATTAAGDIVRIKKCSEPSQGTLTLDEEGNWSYTPTPGFVGRDAFTVGFQVDGFGIPLGSSSSSGWGTATYYGYRTVYINVTGSGTIPVSVTKLASRPTNLRIGLEPPVPGLLAADFSIPGVTVRMAETFDNGSTYLLITTPRDNGNATYTLSISKSGTAPAYVFNPLEVTDYQLNPQPLSFKVIQASFIIKPETKIFVDGGDAEVVASASALAAELRASTGFDIPVATSGAKGIRDISISLIPATEQLAAGYGYAATGYSGYYLEIGIDGAFLKAYTPTGAAAGLETICQLLPEEISSQTVVSDVDWIMPYAEIVGFQTFDVSFVDDDNEYNKIAVKAGDIAVAPDDPTKQYYNFECWLLDGEPYDFEDPVTENLTLVAQWSLVPISSLIITSAQGAPAPAMVTIPRNGEVQFSCEVNPDALPIGIVWSVITPGFAVIDSETGVLKTSNKTGTTAIVATAPSGVSHTIILRIV